MKKNLLFLGLASVMLGFTGCAKDLDAENGTGSQPDAQGEPAPQTIVASMGDNATRTALTPDGKSAAWSAGDQIAIIGSTPGTKDPVPGSYGKDWSKTLRGVCYTLQSGSAGQSVGTFDKTGAADEFVTPLYLGGTLQGKTELLQRYVAIYPAANVSFERWDEKMTTLKVAVPTKQTYVPNSYDPQALSMVSAFEIGAPGEPVAMKFKYVNALLCLPVSAAQGATFDRIVVSGVDELGYPVNVAGKVNLEFNSDPYDGLTPEARLTNYTDMTAPLKPNTIAADFDVPLTLVGSTEHPLTFGSTESKIYFGILPSEYLAIKFSFYFCYSDGSKFEKICAASDVDAGKIIKLPASSVDKPYIPEVSYNGTTKVASWTKDARATTFEANVLLNGVSIAPITLAAGASSVAFETEVYSALNLLGNSVLKGGQEYDLEFVVKATLADKKIASASYAAPLKFKFTKTAVHHKPQIDVALDDMANEPTTNTINFGFYINNYQDLADNSATVTIEYVEKTNAQFPADFTNAKSIAVTGDMYYNAPYSDAVFGWIRGVHYTMVCKAVYADGIVTNSDPITTFVDCDPLPTAITAKVNRNRLRIANYDAIMSGCPDAVIKVYGAKGGTVGESAPVQLFTKAMAMDGMDVSNFPEGKGGELCTYKIVVSSAKLNPSLTLSISEQAVAKPTNITLQPDGTGVVNITNLTAILDFAPDAVFTVYMKKGVNQDMDSVEGLESKILSPDYCVLDCTGFPYDYSSMYYTYKFIATGTGLPAAGISGVYSETAPAKPTYIEIQYDAFMNIHVDNINAIMYHYPDATVKVYTGPTKVTDVAGLQFLTLTAANNNSNAFDPAKHHDATCVKSYYYKIVVETPAHPEGVLSEQLTFTVPGQQ